MISHQTTHSLKAFKKLGILLKLDHSNAFDKLNWNCLFQILHTSSFDHEWISLTKTLISSAFYSIALNGSPHINPFVASSRIWHVDPLSLFRFILAIEGLGRSFKAMILEEKNISKDRVPLEKISRYHTNNLWMTPCAWEFQQFMKYSVRRSFGGLVTCLNYGNQ